MVLRPTPVMRLRRFAAAIVCLGAVLSVAAAGGAVINAGKHFLAPNLGSQFITIFASGGEQVAGIDFFIQMGDGGAVAGGDDVGPTITGVDFGGGGVFATNNSGVFLDPAGPLLWGATTTTTSGTVAATGRLVLLAINTTGITSGRFDLNLSPALTGPTQFPGVATTLINGWVQIGSPSAADFNSDGEVDALDLTAWRAGFGTTGTATRAQGDADGDLDVDGRDFLVWQRQVTAPIASVASAAVPEPTFAAMALAAAAAMLFQRRRARRASKRADA
jgi:hypothetical protein